MSPAGRRCAVWSRIACTGSSGLSAQLGHLDIALDHRQEIVEVVRDAARHDSERFEFARPQQLLFYLFTLRDLRAQLLRGTVQFGRALQHPNLQLLVQSFGVALGSPQILHQILVFELQAHAMSGWSDGFSIGGDQRGEQ
jgi:hypothetical protein